MTSEINHPWECEYGDYDSIPVYDDDDNIVDSVQIIEDCDKPSPPYCQFCPLQHCDSQ